MRHTNFKKVSEDYSYVTYNSSDVTIHRFTKVDGITLLRTITPTAINDFYKVTDTTEADDCFMFVKDTEFAQILRVGDPDVLVIAYNDTVNDLAYAHYEMDGSLIASGNMVKIGDGFYYVEPSKLTESFFVIGGHIKTLTVPYKVVNVDVVSTNATITDKNFINVGYNMLGYLGNKNSYFDLPNNSWVEDTDSTVKASDIAKAVCSKYNLVWDDRDSDLWIGKYVKYIRTYVENEARFKYYTPYITPETNSNNFDLVQEDEDGNYYVRGISILLLQSLETINTTDGAIVTFRGG